MSGRVRLEEAESDDSEGGALKKEDLKKTKAATEATSESESASGEETQDRDLDDNASSPSEGEVEIVAKDGGDNMEVDLDDNGKDNNKSLAGELTIYNFFLYFLTFKISVSCHGFRYS